MQNRRKRERKKINNINDFKRELEKEGYNFNENSEEHFKEKLERIFNIDTDVVESLYKCLEEENVGYRVDDIYDLIDYIEKIKVFDNQHNELSEIMRDIKKLNIDRVEYEREPRIQEDIGDMMNSIEETANKIAEVMSDKDSHRLEKLEKEIDNEYLYAKDIELLKKIIINKKDTLEEKYNSRTQVKTLTIEVPDSIGADYIKAKKGTVEYHEHLNKNIPRMQRLIRNVQKYIKVENKEAAIFKINQSNALQDSINIAVATYDKKKFRAISGSNEILKCCTSPAIENTNFKSKKVNKLGKLGIGYDRVNDSEKKILEEIHKQIEDKVVRDNGELILYSKWEPCPSCYYVINQFRKAHPNINIKVKYIKKYGE